MGTLRSKALRKPRLISVAYFVSLNIYEETFCFCDFLHSQSDDVEKRKRLQLEESIGLL